MDANNTNTATANLEAATILRLNNMKGLIQQGWTSHAYARDHGNHAVHYMDLTAEKWCLAGAYMRTMKLGDSEFELFVNNIIDTAISDINWSDWNDAPGRTQADVLQLLDQAIISIQTEEV